MLTYRHDLYPAVVLYTAYAGIEKDASTLADCLKPPQLLTRHPTPDAHSCNIPLPRNSPECRANCTAKTTQWDGCARCDRGASAAQEMFNNEHTQDTSIYSCGHVGERNVVNAYL
jgi:hypothetical protein